MRKLVSLGLLALALIMVPLALAGSPHFIRSATTLTIAGDTLTVSGKEAGLGDEAQIHVEVTATALCINNGGNHPKATNKADVSGGGDFPVQNGKAEFTISVTAVFQPDCAPPMTVAFEDIVVTDTTNGLVLNLN